MSKLVGAMTSVADILSALGGPSAVARALHLRSSTVGEMKRRGSIPSEYWQDLVLVARRLGRPDVTSDLLAAIHARVAGAQATDVRPPGPAEAGAAFGTRPDAAGTGHFSRFYGRARPHFLSAEAVVDHVGALRDEWERP